MSQYFKFFKEAVSGKGKVKELEVVYLADICSIGVEIRLPPKVKDLGNFTIPCVISEDKINKALCDPGANINLMPYSLFRRLKMGRMRPMSMTIQMTDQSTHSPMGVVEDVLVIVHNFFLSYWFCDSRNEGRRGSTYHPWRPFLATVKAEIKLAMGELELCMNDKK